VSLRCSRARLLKTGLPLGPFRDDKSFEEAAMTINLTREELDLLADLLKARAEELRVEVRRTDDAQYHDQLRELERRTIALVRRFEREQVSDRPA
jgi:hypothetical protein